PLGHAREPRRAGDALASETDRGLGERAERPRPEALGEGAPAGGGAGDGRGADAALGHALGRQRRGRGQPAARVEPGERAVDPHHGEEVAADAAHVWIGDRQREVRRDGGIGGVAAVAEDVEADGRGEGQGRADGVAGETGRCSGGTAVDPERTLHRGFRSEYLRYTWLLVGIYPRRGDYSSPLNSSCYIRLSCAFPCDPFPCL